MDAWTIARRHAAYRRRTAAAATTAAERAWRAMDPASLAGSWSLAKPRILAAVAAGQRVAADTASAYVADMVSAQGGTSTATQQVDASAFAGTAADGRPLADLLQLPIATVYSRLSQGMDVRQALNLGGGLLSLLADTEVADAGRGADSVAMAAETSVEGFIRVVSGAACGRCAILAGRWYRWNAAFDRHPHCHCQQVPATDRERMAPHLTDPHSYFDSLSRAEQDRAFTVAGAQAIRDGADIFQVVNARRGMSTVTTFGRQLSTTTEGVTRRGFAGQRMRAAGVSSPVRLTPQAIYELASDRAEAIRLLYRFGYLL